ncbi:MAG: BatA domain-containing protein [Firmicutes bacterium]|nr:BatA domain-containing protein [Bacillota bacterium]
MQWATALGFLGLIGVLVLILIYILKPNYQQKFISSTYIWKRSLKYKKKKIPISKLRNLLVFLCQLLALTACALILAQPFIANATTADHPHHIIVIEESASMTAVNAEGVTRFERAVEEARILGREWINPPLMSGRPPGQVTIIIAADTPRPTISATTTLGLDRALDNLILPSAINTMSQGRANIEAAFSDVSSLLVRSPSASVTFYSSAEYEVAPENITIIPIRDETEWNLAVLDVIPYFNDPKHLVEPGNNYDGIYVFEAEIASYGRDTAAIVTFRVFNPNLNEPNIEAGLDQDYMEVRRTVNFVDGEPQILRFAFFELNIQTNDTLGDGIFRGTGEFVEDATFRNIAVDSWTHVEVNVQAVGQADSMTADNNFVVFGGTKPVVRIQHISLPRFIIRESDSAVILHPDHPTNHNQFTRNALRAIATSTIVTRNWNVIIEEVIMDRFTPGNADIYVFEHILPDVLPQNGLVILSNPLSIGSQTSRVDPGRTGMLSYNGMIVRPNTAAFTEDLGFNLAGGVIRDSMADGEPYGAFVSNLLPSHPIMQGVSFDGGTVLDRVHTFFALAPDSWPSDFVPVIGVGGNPIVLVQDRPASSEYPPRQTVVITSSPSHAGFSASISWAIMFGNIFNHFFPSTITRHAFNVGQTVSLNSRARALEVFYEGTNPENRLLAFPAPDSTFPVTFAPSRPGTYILRQVPITGEPVYEQFFVRVAREESDFTRVERELPFMHEPPNIDFIDWDLVLYFALGLVLLLFIERILHFRSGA